MKAIAAPRQSARRSPKVLAALSTIAASQTHADVPGGASGASALSSGFQLAFGVSAAVSLLGALAAATLLRMRPRSRRSSRAGRAAAAH